MSTGCKEIDEILKVNSGYSFKFRSLWHFTTKCDSYFIKKFVRFFITKCDSFITNATLLKNAVFITKCVCKKWPSKFMNMFKSYQGRFLRHKIFELSIDFSERN